MYAYLILFVIPYYLGMMTANKTLQAVCMSSCWLTAICGFMLEFIQMAYRKSKYLNQLLNIFELLHYTLIIYFTGLRYMYLGQVLLPPEKAVNFHYRFVNSLISLTSFGKLYSFFRANDTMAKMVILITKVFNDLLPFTLIFILVLTQNCMVYSLSGVRVH